MSEFIEVLDHGHVGLIDHMGSDLSISRAARVSYNAEARPIDAGLINYLMKNHHTTPFEAVEFTFDIKAPIFVLRQWHRHRTWSYNELSGRYRELPQEFYVPELDQITMQSSDNKQMRTDEQNSDAVDIQNCMWAAGNYGFNEYKRMLEMGCPRELARTVLPLSTYSHMFASVDLHNLFGFLKSRLHDHAQYEIRVYAEAMLKLIEPIVPLAVASFKEFS